MTTKAVITMPCTPSPIGNRHPMPTIGILLIDQRATPKLAGAGWVIGR